MECNKCRHHMKETIRQYEGDKIKINYICTECGQINQDTYIWRE
jgi:ribosomal protein L44E